MLPYSAFVSHITSVMDHIPSGVVIALDVHGDSLVANRAACDILGVSATQLVTGVLPAFRTPFAGRAVSVPDLPLWRAMRENAHIETADYEIVRADGMRRFATMSAAPLRDTAGEVQGGVAILVDVTYLRTVESSLRQQRDELTSRVEREQQIAETLQSAQLPRQLPAVAGFKLSALYRPAGQDSRVGGDWYDAFRLPDGRIGLSIGDVMGNGLDAAVTMGKLRQAIQSAGLVLPDPGIMLGAAGSTLALDDGDRIATAVAAVLDPYESTLTFAAAGHPLPLIRRVTGKLSTFNGTGPPLGISGGENQTHLARLNPGDLAVFYTDGLIEATRDAVSGERVLFNALASVKPLDIDNAAAGLHRRVLGNFTTPDDVAILTVARLAD